MSFDADDDNRIQLASFDDVVAVAAAAVDVDNVHSPFHTLNDDYDDAAAAVEFDHNFHNMVDDYVDVVVAIDYHNMMLNDDRYYHHHHHIDHHKFDHLNCIHMV